MPLAPRARIIDELYTCPVFGDQCFRYLIVEAPGDMDATQLRAAEKRVLSERGWTFTPGVTPRHVAADAPHHALFVSFATGRDELRADRRPDIEWSTALKPHLRSLVNRGQAVLALTIERGYHG